MVNIYFTKNGYTDEQRFGKPKSLLFKYMLATSSCWYAGFGSELLLAVSNYMLYLGEQELATLDRIPAGAGSEQPLFLSTIYQHTKTTSNQSAANDEKDNANPNHHSAIKIGCQWSYQIPAMNRHYKRNA